MCARANASAHTKAMKLHFNVFSLLELSVRAKHKNHSYFSHIASVCRRWQWHRAHPEYKTIIFKPSVCFRSDRWCTNAAWRHTLKLLHRTVNWTLKHNLAAMTFLCATKVAVCWSQCASYLDADAQEEEKNTLRLICICGCPEIKLWNCTFAHRPPPSILFVCCAKTADSSSGTINRYWNIISYNWCIFKSDMSCYIAICREYSGLQNRHFWEVIASSIVAAVFIVHN